MEASLTREQPIELREYIAVVRRRKWTILLVLVVVVSGVLGFSLQQTPIYEGRTRLLVKGVPSDSSGYIQPVNLETEAEIVASEPVASRVAEDLDLDIPLERLINDLRVEPASQVSHVLELSYSSTEQTLAKDIPNSYASNYIEFKREKAQQALDIGRAAVEERLKPVQQQLADITQRLASEEARNNPVLSNALETERSALIARLGVLQQRVDDFETSLPLDLAGGEVIEAASLPTRPATPDHRKNAILGGFLGLALGLGVAFLRERLDERIRGREDIEQLLGAPILATIPRAQRSKKARYELVTRAEPTSASSEGYRSLRTNLQFMMSQQELRSVLVTSPSAGEGKTVTSCNLAVAFSQAGQRVILVSADLRRPTLERYFGLEGTRGLSNWLAETDDDIWPFLQDPGLPNLRVIPSGPPPGAPAELLTSRRLRTLLESLIANSDIVLVDSPPSLAVADTSILASQVDGVVLVLNATTTHRSAAARAKEELNKVGSKLIGAVYNAYDPGSSPYYYSPEYYSSSPANEPDGRLTEVG